MPMITATRSQSHEFEAGAEAGAVVPEELVNDTLSDCGAPDTEKLPPEVVVQPFELVAAWNE